MVRFGSMVTGQDEQGAYEFIYQLPGKDLKIPGTLAVGEKDMTFVMNIPEGWDPDRFMDQIKFAIGDLIDDPESGGIFG